MASNVYTLSFPAPYLGLAQSSYKDENYTIGGNNVFSRIHNCSLYNPNGISNSPLMEDKAVGELLHNITDYCVKTDTAYGISNNKVWSINNNNVITEEHTFTGSNDTYGNSVCRLGDYLYYFYNTTNGYNVGRYDLNNNWEDTYSARDTSGSSLTTNFSSGKNGIIPLFTMSVGGDSGSINSICYYGNKNTLNYTTGSVYEVGYCEFDKNQRIVDIVGHNGNVLVAVNDEISKKGDSYIYFLYDNPKASNETAIQGYIHINGKIGCLVSDNGTLYVVYSTEDNVVRVAYLNGSTLVDISSFKGSLPNCFQKTKVMDFLMFKSGTNVVAIGNSAVGLGIATYNYESCNEDDGCISAPFNNLIISGTRQVNNAVSFITNDYNSDSYIETLTIDTENIQNVSTLNSILIITNKLLNGESFDVDVYINNSYHKTETLQNSSGRLQLNAPNDARSVKLVIKWKSNKQVLIKNISFKFNTNEFSSE